MVRAGGATASLTPTDDHLDAGVYLGGYGDYETRGVAEGVTGELTAGALVLESGGTTLAIVSADSLGIGNRLLRDARRRIARRVGLPPGSVLIGCTHTHSAPDLQGLWGGTPEAYRDHVVGRLADAVAEAAEDLREAELSAGSTTIPGDLVHNRRGWEETDRRLTVLRAVAEGGDPIATLANVAIHPTVVGPHRIVTPDFVGAMRDAVAKAHGGTTLFLNGLQGDVVPVAEGDDDLAAATDYGRTLAGHVGAALEGARRLDDGFEVTHTDVTFPVGEAFAAAWNAGRLEPYAELRSDGGEPSAVASRVTRCSLGDDPRLEAVTVPGEGLTRLGRGEGAALRDRLGGDEQLLLGLTHDALGYVVPTDEWRTGRNGDYEESVSLGPETAPRYLSAVRTLF